ncbi:MAG: ParB N-terminal domain-containing protein [Deltaproteobacteria bacterium]|nr:ParB N-terminal domain-containing protein [Deltaproteobacteria bacterium]
MEIKIDLIKIGDRYRNDMGDIQALADSIKDLGQLQPIGVDANYNLIFGERRIKACRLLGMDKVVGNVIHMNNLLAGEYAENEIRKDFTTSECVAIGKAIELELGERRGKPGNDVRDKYPELKGTRTRDVAAEKAGLKNGKNYERAKKVTENGSPELVEKMDKKEVSISAAAKIAQLDAADQEEIIEDIDSGTKPAQAIKKKVSKTNKTEPDNLYIMLGRYFFAYPGARVDAIKKHFNITDARAYDLIWELEDNKVISKPDQYGNRTLGEYPQLPEETERPTPPESDLEPDNLRFLVLSFCNTYPESTTDRILERISELHNVSQDRVSEVVCEVTKDGSLSIADDGSKLWVVNEQPEQQKISSDLKKNKDIANQMSSETNEWYTPDCIIEDVFQVLGGIDLDPCSDLGGNVAAKTIFTKEDDGLSKDWFGSVFMNPPYGGDALDWAKKIISEPIDQAIVLVASNTDARYFHLLLDWCDSVCFVKGRLEFKPGFGQKGGRSTVRNVLFYKGKNNETFFEYFEKYGSVLCL